jgi:hypothetical protein
MNSHKSGEIFFESGHSRVKTNGVGCRRTAPQLEG